MVNYKNVIQVVNSLNTSSLEYNTVQLVTITKIGILVAMLIISASNFIASYTPVLSCQANICHAHYECGNRKVAVFIYITVPIDYFRRK